MIFVTGGTGFLGRHLIPGLCRAGHSVRVLTREPQMHTWLNRYTNVEVVKGDLVDLEALMAAVEGCRYVIHAGGMFRFWGDEAAFMATNALGTANILKAAVKHDIERFIHVSSVAVIGEPDPQHVIGETYLPKPVDAYQRSKLEGEALVCDAHERHGLPTIILRPGAFYGPLGNYGFNRLFFRDPMRGIIMQVNGGRYIIFPAYISDVVSGILLSLSRGEIGEIYNICGDWISHREAFDIICDEANLYWPRATIPGWLGIGTSRVLEFIARFTGREPFWPINLRSYVYNNWRVSNEKARRELGFEPIAFRDGARRTIDWYRAGRPEEIPEIVC
ncbi:MAG: NAD-dependent epimerase/dehydratase family protein [Chloroflexota bacterium]